MKIAICDDEKAVLEQLRGYVERYAASHLFDYTVLEFEDSRLLLEAARQDKDIQILFLDIYMEPLSGMELAERLRADGSSCAIIFVTVSTDHYASSYEVDAEHYLVKPVSYERVCQALDRCSALLAAAAKSISFSTQGREILLPLRQIRFAEVFRNQTIIHADRDIPLRCTLEAVAARLDDRRFIRTHRSYLLNMDYIANRSDNDIFLKTGERVSLSRSYEKQFEREYGRYLTASMTGICL